LVGPPAKITFGEMRSCGVRGVLIYCADYKCSHSIAMPADRWGDDVRLSDIEPRFVCTACGRRGADVRPNFHWQGAPVGGMGYRKSFFATSKAADEMVQRERSRGRSVRV
jgi:hypothetical protein